MNKKWEIYPQEKEKVQEIANKFNISELVATILLNREILEEKDIRIFLQPNRSDFYDPFLLPSMEIAVDRIIKAIEKKEKMIIYGDYDVDGITSIAVLKQFLEERGIEVGYHIPNRLEEGYGLNREAIKQIADEGYTLMVTVDCGISGIEEIEYANSIGIETIVTDHHEPLDELPNAVAVIDPKINNSKYPFNQLAGVGVVFKLIQAIGITLNLEEKEYLKYLDLVCVGTISDIVPLVDENRVIAKLGLKLIEVTKNLGLKRLIEVAGYKKVDSSAISFGIAPRVNACGRMGHEEEALKLFLSKDLEEVNKLTESLNRYNKERQETEKEIVKEALNSIEKSDEAKMPIVVVAGENWHHGVIGIVASKITETYFKPSVLLSLEEGIAKGSGRSILGFDLHDALCKCSNYLEKYGGHEMAVGLSLKEENVQDFKQAMIQYAEEMKIDEIVPVIYIDKQIEGKELNLAVVKELELLEPFGEANKRPLFVYKNLRIDSIRALTEGKHLKLTLKDENQRIEAIGFNMGNLAEEYLIGDKVDVVGTLEINNFNGREQIQINLKDMMKSI